MTGPVDLSVLVPVTERPSPLDRVYREHAEVLTDAGVRFEFLFVLEPSRMPLADPLHTLVAAGAPIRVLAVGQGVGEAGMLQAALGVTRGELLLTLTPYPRIRPEGVLTLLEAVRDQGADLATARRVSERSSFLNRLQRRLFHLLVQKGVGGELRDVASGVRVVRRAVLEQVPIYGDLSRFIPVLAARDGWDVREVPLEAHPEDHPTRVYAPGVYLRRLIDLLGVFFLLRFTRKPLRFFGLLGSLAVSAGSLLFLVLLVERLGGRAMADRPLLLLAVLLVVLGVQAVALGLLGEMIVHLSAGEDRRGYRVRDVTAVTERGGDAPAGSEASPTAEPEGASGGEPGRRAAS